MAVRHSVGKFTQADIWGDLGESPDFSESESVATTAATDDGDWPEPRDVFGYGDPAALLELPEGAFPSVIEDSGRRHCRIDGRAAAYTAVCALAVFSAAIGNKWSAFSRR